MYADRAVLTVRFVPDLGAVADEVWEVTAEGPDFDFKWLYDAARRLASSGGEYHTSVVTVRATRFDWGGDSGSFDVVLTIGQWALDHGLDFGFGLALAKVVEKMRGGSRGGLEGAPLSRQEATERARWKVAAAYELDADRLLITSEEMSGDSWTIGLIDVGQATYEVALALDEGLVVTTRIKRTLDAGTAAAS